MKNILLRLLGLTVLSAPMVGTPQVQSVVDGNTTFALDLYSQLATNSGNLFFSPYSISTCLAMLYAGANGNTERQMSHVLGFGTNQQQFASLFGQLQAELETDQATNAVELNVANALWTQEGFPFLPSFLATATNQYQANVGQADFVTDAEAVRQTINNWVAQETQNRIQNILPPGILNDDTRFVLANTIYFRGAWTTPFDERFTHPGPFYLSRSNLVQVPLMAQPKVYINCMATSDFEAIELPYGSNQVSMLVLLPSQIDGLKQLEQQLSPAFLSNVLGQLKRQNRVLILPKFAVECSFDLGKTLATMGMSDAFTPLVADLSGINGRQDLFVDFVLHKAWGQVNEAGTEGAGGTATGGTDSSLPPEFVADHPFVFLIRDTRTGTVLFLGRLANPSPSDAPATRTLTVTPSAGSLKISWPASLSGLNLQQSLDLANWTYMGGASYDGTNNSITLPASRSRCLFFRLSQQ